MQNFHFYDIPDIQMNSQLPWKMLTKTINRHPYFVFILFRFAVSFFREMLNHSNWFVEGFRAPNNSENWYKQLKSRPIAK